MASLGDLTVLMRRTQALFLPNRTLIAAVVLGMMLSFQSNAFAQEEDGQEKLSKAQEKTETKAAQTGTTAKGAKRPAKPTKAAEKQEVTTIQAEQVTGRPDREVFFDRDVEVVRGQTRITSDQATYYQEDNVIEAEGNLHMTRFGDQYWGDRGRFNVDTGEGWVLNPRYRLIMNKAQGKGTRADFESNELSTVSEGTYSTCEGTHPDWYVRGDTLRLDRTDDTGEATNALLYFKDVPILGVPKMTFPLTEGRKSGVLPPTFGTSSSGGFEAMVPYYFNIAPNRDFTLYPKYTSKRGLQLSGDARYLEQNFSGETRFEYLLDDPQLGNSDRYAFSSQHTQKLAPGLMLGWNLNIVSDDEYLIDFTSHFPGMMPALTGLTNASTSPSAQRLLSREIGLDYSGSNWSTNFRVTNYQMLQDKEAATAERLVRPYERLPQLTYKMWQPTVSGFDYGVKAEWTHFWLSQSDLLAHRRMLNNERIGEFGDTGDRLLVKPEVGYSIIEPSYFIKPKLSVHAVHYDVENDWDGSRSINMTVPTFSVDSGLLLEREVQLFGKEMTQTLEPRLFYVYTPYRDQSDHPNFDSAEPGLTFAQLFSENRFSGSDRIADANQLTAALISRFIDPNGAERARFAIGQRFYYDDQRVYLESSNNETHSDLLAAASLSVIPKVTLDSAIQYSETQSRMTSASASIQWKPAYKEVFNASYRYLRDKPGEYVGIDQINLSTQWPIYKRWYGAGMVSYSIPDSKFIQAMVGLEYNADCWVFRVVANRVYSSTDLTETAYFVQLELKGLSKLGTPAMETLRGAVSGYDYLDEGSKKKR